MISFSSILVSHFNASKIAIEWTLEFDEKLIMCAMDYPCIYDVKIPEYRNAEVKATAFLKIAKGIGCDVAEVKQKWTKLKEKYCRERGSIKKPSGSPVDEPHTSKWALFECISFYDKYIQRRSRSGNFPSTLPDRSDSTGSYISVEDVQLSDTEDKANSASHPNQGQSKETPILMATPAAKKIVATPTTPHIVPKVIGRRKTKIASGNELELLNNLGSLLESCKDSTPTTNSTFITIENSVWNSYGISVGKTLAKMSLPIARRVRQKIENAVFTTMSQQY